MIPSSAIAPLPSDGLSSLHHTSSLHLSPHRSLVNPSLSQKPDENLNRPPPHSPSMSTENTSDPALGPRSSGTLNKRKRDSESRTPTNGSQLREAQEKVEQKRAKIAARVPSAMAPGKTKSSPATITSLADLYSQMRRDSGTSDRRRAPDAFKITPSPKVAVPPNGRALHRRPQNNAPGPGAPRGDWRSVASSPDPIAMSEDDQEIVLVKHIPPSPTQVRARLEPVTRIGPPTHSKPPSSKAKSRSSTPKSTITTGTDKLSDKSRKSRTNFAIVIPSPPKRPSLVEKNASRSDASRSQEPTPTGTPVPNHTERLKEITNVKASEPHATHTPQPAPVRPTRSAESITDSIFEYGPKRLRRGAEDLTARDIDALLGAVPVPFDFSLPYRHIATREHGESDVSDEEGNSSLWWHHPIFEARAKADIRRTLAALLPDPAQDPPLPGSGDDVGGWKAEVRPRQSGAQVWAERLEGAFGPGPLDRGVGRKPRRLARPAGAARRGAADSRRSQNGTPGVGALVIVNSHGPPRRSIEPPRPPSPQHNSSNDAAESSPRPAAAANTGLESSVEDSNSNSNVNNDEVATGWTAALLPLVKGKTTMDEMKMVQTSAALSEVERADRQQGGIAREVLKESALADTVRRLAELESVPFGDVYYLRARARTLTDRWKKAFGDEVVDLQCGVLLPLSK